MIVRRFFAAVIALALAAAACGERPDDRLPIVIKRVALNLAFADEKLAKDGPEVRRIVGRLPAARPSGSPNVPPSTQLPDGFSVLPPCPKASEGANPKEAVTMAVRQPPKEGVYTKHNKGTIKATGGTAPITLPFPPISTVEIRKVKTQTEPSSTGAAPETIGTFETFERLYTLTILRSWRYDANSIDLLREVIRSDDAVFEFEPTPAITFMELGEGTGDSWNSAGIDTDNRVSRLFQGSIPGRKVVDVCGEVFDTWEVNALETTTDLGTGDTSGTDDPENPNRYWVATHLGALILSQEGHFTQRLTIDGSPVIAEFDYVSTHDSVEPIAPPTGDDK